MSPTDALVSRSNSLPNELGKPHLSRQSSPLSFSATTQIGDAFAQLFAQLSPPEKPAQQSGPPQEPTAEKDAPLAEDQPSESCSRDDDDDITLEQTDITPQNLVTIVVVPVEQSETGLETATETFEPVAGPDPEAEHETAVVPVTESIESGTQSVDQSTCEEIEPVDSQATNTPLEVSRESKSQLKSNAETVPSQPAVASTVATPDEVEQPTAVVEGGTSPNVEHISASESSSQDERRSSTRRRNDVKNPDANQSPQRNESSSANRSSQMVELARDTSGALVSSATGAPESSTPVSQVGAPVNAVSSVAGTTAALAVKQIENLAGRSATTRSSGTSVGAVGQSQPTSRDVPETSALKTESRSAAEAVSRAKLVQRISRAFQHLGTDGGTVRLRLAPAELGSVRVEMHIQGRKVNAKVVTENEVTSELVREHIGDLRGRLESQGIQIELITVETDESSLQGNTNDSRREAPESREEATIWRRPNAPSAAKQVSRELTYATASVTSTSAGVDVRW
jgi:flagellar hook-length control protein FliK